MLKLLFALFGFAAATLSDCGLGKSVFTLQDQNFLPSPPIAGQEYEYWFTYTVPANTVINSGSTEYAVTLNGIPFTPSVEDLCSQTVCPKVEGLYNESSHNIWNGGISGKIIMKLSWYDGNNNLLLCSQVTERI